MTDFGNFCTKLTRNKFHARVPKRLISPCVCKHDTIGEIRENNAFHTMPEVIFIMALNTNIKF